MLPARPAILPDELFSSWFVRLARANALRVQELLTLTTRTRRSFMGRDLDAVMDEGFAFALERLCGISAKALLAMTFDAHRMDLTAIDQPKEGARRWVLPKVTKDRRATHPWLQFCHDCLRSDAAPYFRTHWRYAFVTTCAIHSVRLATNCPWCDRPFDFEGYDIHLPGADRALPLTACTHCRRDMRDIAIHAVDVDRRVVRYQRALCAALRRGGTRVRGTGAVYSHQIFDVLHRMLRHLRGSDELQRLFGESSRSLEVFPKNMCAPLGRFESWPIDVRHECMTSLSGLLRGWSTHFVDQCYRFNVLRTAIHGHRGALPYWFDRVLNEHLYRPWYKPSQDEINAVRQAIVHCGQPDTQYNVRRWLGRYCQKIPAALRLSAPSPEQLTLFASEELRRKSEEERAREFPSREEFERIRPTLERARIRKKHSQIDLYAVWCAALYRERTRCSWAALPSDFPKAATVYWYYTRWQSLASVSALPGGAGRCLWASQPPTRVDRESLARHRGDDCLP